MAAPQYATESDLKLVCDTRLLAELATDTDVDDPLNGTSTVIVNALQRASSDVESHVLRGGRYDTARLSQMQTDGDQTLIGLVCDLAIVRLFNRRGFRLPPVWAEANDRAKQTLEDLGNGLLIFGKSTDAADAGTGEVDAIPGYSRSTLRLASDQDYFPPRISTLIT